LARVRTGDDDDRADDHDDHDAAAARSFHRQRRGRWLAAAWWVAHCGSDAIAHVARYRARDWGDTLNPREAPPLPSSCGDDRARVVLFLIR